MEKNRQTRHAILADDLTGAMDAAAAFVRHGFTACVALDPRRPVAGEAEIAVLCTHSRAGTPGAARRAVLRACRQARRGGRALGFKKIDSTAQGNIAAETEAMRRAGGFAAAVICPAHPVQGRRVRRSVLRVRAGKTIDLAAHFRGQGLVAHCAIADAATGRDLAKLVAAARKSPRPILLAGSAAMAEALAAQLQGSGSVRAGRIARRPPLRLRPSRTPGILIFAGSTNPVTIRQLSVLARRTGALSVPLRPFPLGGAASALILGRPVIVRVPTHRVSDRAIQRALRSLAPLFQGLVSGLVLTGGDTAALVCRWLRADAIAVAGEIDRGLAWGRLVGGAGDGLAVATKPGGFGRDQGLVRALGFLTGASAATRMSPSPS